MSDPIGLSATPTTAGAGPMGEEQPKGHDFARLAIRSVLPPVPRAARPQITSREPAAALVLMRDDAQPLDTQSGGRGGSSTTITVANTTRSVSGKTLTDVWSAMTGSGAREAASVRPQFTPDPQYQYDDQDTVRSVVVSVKETKEMPSWAELSQQCKPIQDEWGRFFRALDAHENNHLAIDRKDFTNVHQQLVGKKRQDAWNALDSIIAAADAENDAYDAKTQHGVTEGSSINAAVQCTIEKVGAAADQPPADTASEAVAVAATDTGATATDQVAQAMLLPPGDRSGTLLARSSEVGGAGREPRPRSASTAGSRLVVSQPDDPLEREADRVAGQVMQPATTDSSSPSATVARRPLADEVLHRACGCSEGDGEHQCASCAAEERKKRHLARLPVHDRTPDAGAIDAADQVLSTPGAVLDPAVRGFMESRFGHDFGQVRVHADPAAARSAAGVAARAFTVGADVVFGPGQYAPETAEGRRLIAHELTHVVQQGYTVPLLPADARSPTGGDHAEPERAPGVAPVPTAVATAVADVASGGTILRDPAPTPPAANPDAQAAEDRHRQAFDALQPRVGQTGANVTYSDPDKSPVDAEAYTIQRIADRASGDQHLKGFDTSGAAAAYATIASPGQPAAVLEQDTVFFAAPLNPGKRPLLARSPGITSFSDWWSALPPRKVDGGTAVKQVLSKDGLSFPLGTILPMDPNLVGADNPYAAQLLKKDQTPQTVNAADLRAVAGLGDKPGSKVDIKPEQQEAFIISYFRSRGDESLTANETMAQQLAAQFKPAAGRGGVSPDAQRLIDSSRKLAVDFRALLETQAIIQGKLDYVTNAMSREIGGAAAMKLTIDGKEALAVDWKAAYTNALDDIAKAVVQIRSASPMLALMVPEERQAPPTTATSAISTVATVAAGLLNPVAAIAGLAGNKQVQEFVLNKPRTLQGQNQVDASGFGQPQTAENDEKLRADFEKKLDVVRQAIRKARADIIYGDEDLLLGMSGLRAQASADLSKNDALKQKLQDMLQANAVKELAWTIAETVVQVGALFLPGGVFISAAIGFGIQANELGKDLQQMDVAAAGAMNPSTALADQQDVQDKLAMATLMLALTAIDLGHGAIEGLAKLESGGKAISEAQRLGKWEFEDTVRGENHAFVVDQRGLGRCSFDCGLFLKNVKDRVGKLPAITPGSATEAKANALIDRAAANNAQWVSYDKLKTALTDTSPRSDQLAVTALFDELKKQADAIEVEVGSLEREQFLMADFKAKGYTSPLGETDTEVRAELARRLGRPEIATGKGADIAMQAPDGSWLVGEGKGSDLIKAHTQLDTTTGLLIEIDPAAKGRIHAEIIVPSDTFAKLSSGAEVQGYRMNSDGLLEHVNDKTGIGYILATTNGATIKVRAIP